MSKTNYDWNNCTKCNYRGILEECLVCEELYCDDCIEEHEAKCCE